MQLGNFSISLPVKDINASKTFYQKLGFAQCAGDLEQNWIILQNGDHTIGLFQGMFEKNMLTFNPGWDDKGQPVKEYTDVRELKQKLTDQGIAIDHEENIESTGPASIMITDPDGNPILIDQHV
jgi:lactoylglutathione lyase